MGLGYPDSVSFFGPRRDLIKTSHNQINYDSLHAAYASILVSKADTRSGRVRYMGVVACGPVGADIVWPTVSSPPFKHSKLLWSLYDLVLV